MVTNGRIPLAQLSKVDAVHYASPGCVTAFKAWSKRMVALGYPALTAGNASDSCYRSYEWQVWRYTHQPPVAAYPGTSNHGWGQAIDIGNYYRYPHWLLVREGSKYGFIFDTSTEAWHVKYTGAPNYKTITTTGGTTTPLIQEDETMQLIYIKDTKVADADKRILIGEFTWDHITGAQSERERILYGIKNFDTAGQAKAELATVNRRREQINLPALVDTRLP